MFSRARLALASVMSLASLMHAADYVREVKPVLKSHCYACHGALKQKAGLRLDTVAALKKGGDNGDATKLIIERVTTTVKKDHMPPEGDGSALNADELARLKAWFAAGAPAPEKDEPDPDPRAHWAYQVPRSSKTGLDAMIDKRLAENHLQPQAAIAPGLWLRRVCLDLIGLPPSPEDIASFLQDTSLPARERVVDRLLASPQYGERWARHFMDIWRYCDWYGLGPQLRHSQKHIWHWRDWIIESLNADKGYDRMIVDMLAADEASPGDRDNLRATGFLARSYYLFNRTTWLDDTIEHTSRALLGVTMQCVKCHDHKYDPIEQADYYRMRAVFEPVHVRLDPWPGETNLEKNGLPRVFDLHNDRATYRHVRGDEQNEDKSRPLPPGVPAVLSFAKFEPLPVSLPETSSRPELLPFVVKDQLHAAELELAKAKDDPQAAEIARAKIDMIRAIIAAGKDPALAGKAAAAEARHKLLAAEAGVRKQEAALEKADAKQKPAMEKALTSAREALEKAKKRAATPGGTYSPLRASLKAQEGPEENNNADVQKYPATSTGRRLAFAQWIADRRNPLTARVLVNHVWLRHLGTPLVADVGDFGRRATAPLHQDVLDTLAVGFMESGWSIKQLHRKMVLSDLYARSSSNAAADSRTLAADPDNIFYWRMNPRRMESQVVRDSLLKIAGKLDPTIGGASLDAVTAETSPRRSLYFTQNADIEHRFLATFDNANVLECYRRNESVVPQQALALTNSRLSRECAGAVAAKLERLADDAFIHEAFLIVLGRTPGAAEQDASRQSLAVLSRILFLQALVNHNDFVTLR